MAQTIEQGDIFGRIGKAIGQGASEQVDRSMLANKLRGIKGFPSEGADIISAPGGQEILPSIMPFLSSERNRAAEEKRQQSLGTQGTTQKSTGTPGGINLESENFLVPKTGPQLGAEALEMHRTTSIPYDQALKQLSAEDQQRILTEQAFETRAGLAEKDFDSYLDTELQKSGNEAYRDITGEMRNEYRKLVREDIAKGKYGKTAQLQRAKELLDFAKTRGSLETNPAAALLGIGIPAKERQSAFRAQRKEYLDKDQLELYANDLQNKAGLSQGIANYLAYPIKENKKIYDFERDSKIQTPEWTFFRGNRPPSIRDKEGKGTSKRTEKQIGEFISSPDVLKDSDSLLSIATAFNSKGYNPQKILDAIQSNWESGKLRLNKRQERELQNRSVFRPTLRDLAYFADTGLNPEG